MTAVARVVLNVPVGRSYGYTEEGSGVFSCTPRGAQGLAGRVDVATKPFLPIPDFLLPGR